MTKANDTMLFAMKLLESQPADSLLDRIKYDAYKINIQAVDENHDRSMRELYGLKPEESQ
jgi:hypothetical protein